jgi:non-heme Fe2+,alpha-ketoglutarate-dependent halogenase
MRAHDIPVKRRMSIVGNRSNYLPCDYLRVVQCAQSSSLTCEGLRPVTNKLSRQQLEQYDRDGIVFPVKVFSADETLQFRRALESIALSCGEGSLKRFDSLHLFFDWAYHLVTHDALLNAVEDILGEDILVDGTLVFYKPPQNSSYVSWHQDSVYSGWHLTPSVSAWVALTPSRPSNGCMRVIPGSHKQGLLSHANAPSDSNLLFRGEQVGAVDEASAVDVILQPGEMSLHHSTLIHGSNPNTSDEPRIGFIVRFVTNQIKHQARPLLRVRGHSDCSHLNLAHPPVEADEQTALSAWRSYNGS